MGFDCSNAHMKTIIIDDFKHLEFKDIYERLMVSEETHYEVLIKREYEVGSPEKADSLSWSVLFAYYYAAFAGQKLAKASTSFCYWVPSVESNSPFRFQLVVNDIEEFADIISYIVIGYFNMDEQEWESSFVNQATVFHTSAWNFDVDVACWGLVYIASEYLVKVNGNKADLA